MNSSDPSGWSRRGVLSATALAAGLAAVAPPHSVAQAVKSHDIAPVDARELSTFLMNASFDRSIIHDFSRHDIAARRDQLDGIARNLGGELKQFFIVAGDWQVTALFTVPHATSNRLSYDLIASELFAGEISFGRVWSAAEVDHLISAAEAFKSPWHG